MRAREEARDPNYDRGITIPIVREACSLPRSIKQTNPLYVDLKNDRQVDPWDKLLQACGADLGVSVPDWLNARDEIRESLSRNQSISLIVTGGEGLKWRELIADLRREAPLTTMGQVDLTDPATFVRPGLVRKILEACGRPASVPDKPNDLPRLSEVLEAAPGARITLTRFDHVEHRADYERDFFTALRYLVQDAQRLVILVHSNAPFQSLLPEDHPFSRDSGFTIPTVELRKR